MDKQYFVSVVNPVTGKVFSLPTLYTDRTEACVCGQNYIRDRQAEDRFTPLFFRVMISYDGKVAEPFIFNDDEDDEEPEHGESVYGNAEEPSSESLAEILSVLFSAVRLDY